MSEFHHISVLLHECLEGLDIKPDGIYVAGTLGGAGHSGQIAARLHAGPLSWMPGNEDSPTWWTRRWICA